MFQKNINAIKFQNKELVQRLEKVSLESAKEHIKVYNAESGDIIIAFDNIALDDVKNPIGRAKDLYDVQVKNQLTKTDIVVLYGFGIGYLLKRAYISSNAKILVYEQNLEILRFVFEYIDFSAEILSGRVFIFDSQNEIFSFLEEKYLPGDKIELSYLDSYAAKKSQDLINFSSELFKACKSKISDVNTIAMLAKSWAKNFLLNSKYINRSLPLNKMKDVFDSKTALILGAGPSLKTNISLIKENREKFVIFAVNKVADYLFDSGITPDFLVAADAHKINMTMAKASEYAKNVHYILTTKTDNFVFAQGCKSYVVYYLGSEPFDADLAKVFPKDIELYRTAGTAISQAYVSAKVMGFKNIVFAGMDLAFKGDEVYFNQKGDIDPYYVVLSHKTTGKDLSYTAKKLVEVKSFNGGTILTRDDYAQFIVQMEELFSDNEKAKIYNITDFGAYIKGMDYKPLSEIVDILENEKNSSESVDSAIYSTFEKNKNSIEKLSVYFVNLITKEKNAIEKMLNQLIVWLKIRISDKEKAFSAEEYEQIKREELNFVKGILDSKLMSTAFQIELLKYSELNSPKLEKTDENLKVAREYSIEMFNKIVEELKNMLELYKLL